MRVTMTVAIVLLLASSAQAFSGAEFLSSSRDLADGYAWGLLDYRMSVADGTDAPTKLWHCMNDAGVNSQTFGDAVRGYINSSPERLTNPALSSVLQVANQMCPYKP